jgi:hypothetical protein
MNTTILLALAREANGVAVTEELAAAHAPLVALNNETIAAAAQERLSPRAAPESFDSLRARHLAAGAEASK